MRRAGDEPASLDEDGREGRQEDSQVVLQPPGGPARPVAVRRRVEEDPVVATPASCLAGDEPPGVVDEPADRPVGEPRELRVAPGPGHRGARGVHVRDQGTGTGEREGREAGVGEEVEHRGRPPRRGGDGSGPPGGPAGHGHVLREDAHPAGTRRPELQGDVVHDDRPMRGQAAHREPGARGRPLVAVEAGIGARPCRRIPARLADGRRRRPIEDDIAEPLEAAPLARIEERVVDDRRLHPMIVPSGPPCRWAGTRCRSRPRHKAASDAPAATADAWTGRSRLGSGAPLSLPLVFVGQWATRP